MTKEQKREYDRTRYAAFRGQQLKQENARKLLAKYSLTAEQASILLNHGCALCSRPATDIDHDHATGKVREGLCRRCNSFVGWIENNEEDLLPRVLAYIKKHRIVSCS
jgi:hypothetical protein